jgi:heme/copper-type cytochrome/quinol oxidase subunit 2
MPGAPAVRAPGIRPRTVHREETIMTLASRIVEKALWSLAVSVLLIAAALFTVVYVVVIGVLILVRWCRAQAERGAASWT